MTPADKPALLGPTCSLPGKHFLLAEEPGDWWVWNAWIWGFGVCKKGLEHTQREISEQSFERHFVVRVYILYFIKYERDNDLIKLSSSIAVWWHLRAHSWGVSKGLADAQHPQIYSILTCSQSAWERENDAQRCSKDSPGAPWLLRGEVSTVHFPFLWKMPHPG